MQQADNPDNHGSRRRQTRLAGIRFVGIFVPWQAVALTLAVLVGVTAVAASRGSRPEAVRVEQASSDTPTEAAVPATTPTTAQPATTTTAPTPTTTTQAPTTTTRPPTTTTTTIAPGSAEVVILGGGITYGAGQCAQPADAWRPAAGCPEHPNQDLDFTLDASRYPKGSAFRLEANVQLEGGTTYCLRVFDVDRNAAIAGSEHCWTAPYVPPTPPPPGLACCNSPAPPAAYSGEIGPMTVPAGRTRYTLQARVVQADTGAGCYYHSGCSAGLSRAKIAIEWG